MEARGHNRAGSMSDRGRTVWRMEKRVDGAKCVCVQPLDAAIVPVTLVPRQGSDANTLVSLASGTGLWHAPARHSWVLDISH